MSTAREQEMASGVHCVACGDCIKMQCFGIHLLYYKPATQVVKIHETPYFSFLKHSINPGQNPEDVFIMLHAQIVSLILL